MNEALEKLKNIGAQKIYEETHIPLEHVQAIIHESFDGFSKVQFLGFVSILEREYKENLSELRIHGLKSFEDEKLTPDTVGVFVVPKRRINLTLLYIFLAILAFLTVAYFKLNSSEQIIQTPPLDNSVIISAQKNIEPTDANESILIVSDTNQSLSDSNLTQDELIIVEEPIVKSLKFTSKSKLWLGYIDLETNRHYNKIFTGEFSLDPEKDWLLVFGHGFVDIILNDELLEFHSNEKVRFLYKDAEMKSITLREFKKLNRGNAW